MNLSPDWIALLSGHGFEAVHWSRIGAPNAPDSEIMQWARENGYVVFTHDLDFGTRSDYVKWIGFSFDESARALRMMNGQEYKDGLIRFPLIQDVLLRRRESIKLVADMGWPIPPRSNCWMCPNQGDHEWRELKANHPEEFQLAVDAEREIHARDEFAFLHSSCIPLDQVSSTVSRTGASE